MNQKLPAIVIAVLFALSFFPREAQPQPEKPSSRPPCRELKIEGAAEGTGQVHWLSPSQEEEITTLNKWCATVGPARVHVPAHPAAPGRGRILVVTWNIHVGNGDLEELIGNLTAAERAEGLDDPDFVFLLQEAFRTGPEIPGRTPDSPRIPDRIGGASMDLPGLAKRLGFWMYYAPSMRNGSQSGPDAQDRGNAILSSLPLAEFHAIELPVSVQRRVALAATVHNPASGVRFRVAVTHLDTRAPLTKGSIFGAPAARNRQAQWLTEALSSLQEDGLPLIVGGDLNTHFGRLESAVETLSRIAPRIECGGKPTHTSGLMLDYIFAQPEAMRATASCKRLDSRFASDHYPLVLPVR